MRTENRHGTEWWTCDICSYSTTVAAYMGVHMLGHIHDRLVDLEEAVRASNADSATEEP